MHPANWARLCIEAFFLGGAAAALVYSERRVAAASFMLAAAFHYSLSRERVMWLLER